MLIKQTRITPDDCRAHPDHLYAFGDNMQRWGKAGQACIRDEPNSVGIPTKHFPSMVEPAFFVDADIRSPWASGAPTMVRRAIDDAFEKLEGHIARGGVVVIPTDGVGTGLAELPSRAPEIYAYIGKRLAAIG